MNTKLLMNTELQTGTFPTMFHPSTELTYDDSSTSDGKTLPDLSPEARISEHDHDQIAFFSRQVLNGTLDYLIINVFGAGANLPVRDGCLCRVCLRVFTV